MYGLINNPTNSGFRDAACSGDGHSDCMWWMKIDMHTTSTLEKLLAKDFVANLRVLGW